MPTSNIDDMLMGAKTPQHPETPENQHQEGPEEVKELEPDTPDYGEDEPQEPSDSDDEPHESDDSDEPEPKPTHEYDDYGNEKEPENKEIRERLKKQARKYEAEIESLRSQLAQHGASQQVQQAAKDFEYDPEANGDWQQQLASFVKQTVNSMTREKQESEVRQQDAHTQREFESKFRDGMGRFNDFVDVIDSLPFQISNPMTLATRGMADPAAFLYAAAKRNPQELERISKIRDPYAQMTEMGKLEERMRRNKPTTKAPRPLSRTNEDASIPNPKKKGDPTIEELIAKADQKKLARVKGRAGGGRR
jgi:hypothetical protein